MIALFSLLPLFAALLLYLPIRRNFRSEIGLALALSLLSAGIGAYGWQAGLLAPSLGYVLLFGLFGFFPVPFRKELERETIKFHAGRDVLRSELEIQKKECKIWSDKKAKFANEMDRVLKRYAFARTLVARMEEKPILLDLSSTFGSQKKVLGFSFSKMTEEEESEETPAKTWTPVFTSGWIAEEDWKKILANPNFRVDAPDHYVPASDSPVAYPGNTDALVLVPAPVKWRGKVQGLLTLILEGSLPVDFLEEISVYAQLLGMGLYKALLHRMVVEHSRRDGLTNLYLRAVFMERLQEEINFSKRYGTSFSVLMLDLDHFKNVNDTYGHMAGDRVLKAVADTLRKTLHSGVTISRYGGEEFAVLIGLAPAPEVVQSTEEVRKAVQHLNIPAHEPPTGVSERRKGRVEGIRITLSAGVAHYLPDAPSPEELIRRADAMLYKAKEAGRNCVREWKQS